MSDTAPAPPPALTTHNADGSTVTPAAETVTAAPTQQAPVEAPPDNIGGQEALDGEGGGDNVDTDGRPLLRHEILKGRTFHLRSGVPNALLGRLQATTKKVAPLADKKNEELTDAEKSIALDAQIAFYDALRKLIVEDERDAFQEYAEDVDPPIDGDGWSLLVSTAIQTITGRPTSAP